MIDYWLNKLFFDLQQPKLAGRFKTDPESVLLDYPMRPHLHDAVIDDDLAVLAQYTNAYLLRFYFAIRGVGDAEFIERLNALSPNQEAPHG